MARWTIAASAALALMLAGCGSDKTDAPLAALLAAAASNVATPKAKAAPIRVTRKQVTDTGLSLIRIRLPNRGIESYITRRDSNSGTESWATGDNSVVTFRNGVLISTRAIAPDLMSASVPTVAQLANSGGSHNRTYFVLGDNDATDRLDYACTMASLGPERLDIIERVHATTHMQETCTGDAGKIVNDYWIEGRGFIRQSRQWTNASVGYIEVARLTE